MRFATIFFHYTSIPNLKLLPVRPVRVRRHRRSTVLLTASCEGESRRGTTSSWSSVTHGVPSRHASDGRTQRWTQVGQGHLGRSVPSLTSKTSHMPRHLRIVRTVNKTRHSLTRSSVTIKLPESCPGQRRRRCCSCSRVATQRWRPAAVCRSPEVTAVIAVSLARVALIVLWSKKI